MRLTLLVFDFTDVQARTKHRPHGHRRTMRGRANADETRNNVVEAAVEWLPASQRTRAGSIDRSGGVDRRRNHPVSVVSFFCFFVCLFVFLPYL